MNKTKYILAGLVALLGLGVLSSSCKKDENLVAPDFERELKLLERQKTALDDWILTEYTNPYNIEVLWRWTTKESGYDLNYIPPKTENVKPFLLMLKNTFIGTYEEVMGKAFIKPLVPKQFLLLGEFGYTFGARRLGQAEAGSKFVFYGVDYWDREFDDYYPGQQYPFIREAIHTMYHEFAHILHQTKLFSEDFQKLSKSDYTIRWNDFNDLQAVVKGFSSNYSMKNHNEDFVELIAFYTTLTPEQWEERISMGVVAAENKIKAHPDDKEPVSMEEAEKGKALLQKKISMVKDYLKSSWEIELDVIRDVALKNAEAALKNPEILPQTSPSVVTVHGSVAKSSYTLYHEDCSFGIVSEQAKSEDSNQSNHEK